MVTHKTSCSVTVSLTVPVLISEICYFHVKQPHKEQLSLPCSVTDLFKLQSTYRMRLENSSIRTWISFTENVPSMAITAIQCFLVIQYTPAIHNASIRYKAVTPQINQYFLIVQKIDCIN